MSGFKDFLMRGNLIDLAIAFVLGAAFGDVVEAFTRILLDVIGLAGGNPDFSSVAVGPVNIGGFLTALVSFLIISAILYFGLVRPYEAVRRFTTGPESPQPGAPTSEELLTEIRDLLRTQQR